MAEFAHSISEGTLGFREASSIAPIRELMQSSESRFITGHADFRAAFISAQLWRGVGAGSKIGRQARAVVFVCEHGSAKSVIAASEFERIAKEQGLEVKILARGANPDAEIPKLVRYGLKADGYNVGTMKPTKVSGKDLKGATKVVSFGPDLKLLLADGAMVSDWSATRSVSEDYRAARDYIRQQLERSSFVKSNAMSAFPPNSCALECGQ